MATWKSWTPLLGLVLVCLAATAYALGTPAAEMQQPLTSTIGDLATVSAVEVRDNDTPLLSGQFSAEIQDDDEIKREAVLTAVPGGTAKGEAEIEFDADDRSKQELEVEVEGLAARTTYQVIVDRQLAGTITTDARGKGSVEFARGTNNQ